MADDIRGQSERRRKRDRVTAACDLCKRRKVKCDGEQPCAYCKKKNRAATCHFTIAKERGHIRPVVNTPVPVHRNSTPHSRAQSEGNMRQPPLLETTAEGETSLSPTASRTEHPSDTVVPLEGRILRDAQVNASRDSIIEVARPEPSQDRRQTLPVNPHEVEALVQEYGVAASGLVDLFDHEDLLKEIKVWASSVTSHTDDAAAAVFFLVLSIGAQESDEDKSEVWFDHARDLLLKNMCNSMNVATVQGFTLVAVSMLRAFQPNGAYLYFSLAARTAYAIGIHRTEVNASFGRPVRTMRDRIWKSLRVVDMLISNVLGRPPSTSDVDCTVKYNVLEMHNGEGFNILDPSVQIFMIIERVVVEVYSRKRISIRIADYVSRQLKGWASNWLRILTEITVNSNRTGVERGTVVGACSTLCSYYYGIMLLTRPFLIYEIYEHLGASLRGGGTQIDHREKRKYADAALDGAASFVDTLKVVIQTNTIPRRMPLIVPWLFTAALVLAVGILGRSGLAFEESCESSIRCLDYFGQTDPHARQYSVIVQSLLKITIAHVKTRELQQQLRRKQASSDLFGLLPSLSNTQLPEPANDRNQLQHAFESTISQAPAHDDASTTAPLDWNIYDADFFALPWPNENDRGLQYFLQPGTHDLDGATVADIPLFPIYDQQMGGNFR